MKNTISINNYEYHEHFERYVQIMRIVGKKIRISNIGHNEFSVKKNLIVQFTVSLISIK